MGIELFGPVCTSCWLGLIGSGQWRWSHSFDSLTENLSESHVGTQPTQTGGWRGMWLFTLWCQCQEVWLWVVFIHHWECSRSEIQTVCLIDIVNYGAKFCLIWHSLSKPAMFLSSALLLLAAGFRGTICLKMLKPQSLSLPENHPWRTSPLPLTRLRPYLQVKVTFSGLHCYPFLFLQGRLS